ncbi:hypothetical protein V5O48_005341 [Marasmius crinis-equi]|uniref:Uncharacterized protein n=1 Tax=Marasmius crinis-equi TaxID=585013 RepID=A0ABR3FMJ7_9AGAR
MRMEYHTREPLETENLPDDRASNCHSLPEPTSSKPYRVTTPYTQWIPDDDVPRPPDLAEPPQSGLSPVQGESNDIDMDTFATSYPSVKSIQDRLANWQKWHKKCASLSSESFLDLSLPDSRSCSSLSTTRFSSSAPEGPPPLMMFSLTEQGGEPGSDNNPAPRRAPFADLSRCRITNLGAKSEPASPTPNRTFESSPTKPLHCYRNWMDSYKEHNRLTGSRIKIEEAIAKLKSQSHLQDSGEDMKTPDRKCYPKGSYWSPDTP